MKASQVDVEGYITERKLSPIESDLFRALFGYCDERFGDTKDAVGEVMLILAPVVDQANEAAIYAQTLQQIAKRPRDAARLAYDALDASCSCPRYGPENGFDEGCPIHGNRA